MIQGAHWTLVAEDGKPYSYRRDQYTALLPAAKTMDVLLTPDSGGVNYAIMDRRLSLSNAGCPTAACWPFLQYGALGVDGGGRTGDTNRLRSQLTDTYNSIVGVTLNVGAPDGRPDQNDDQTTRRPAAPDEGGGRRADQPPAAATYTLNTNGSFTYTPPAAH